MIFVQVYRARLASTGEEVAVKVQRPSALSIISKVGALQALVTWHASALSSTRPQDVMAGADVMKILQDLYVMRRAVVLYERLIRRFTAQTTDYQILLSTFAGDDVMPSHERPCSKGSILRSTFC